MICCTTPTADQNKEDGNRFAPSAFKPQRRFGTFNGVAEARNEPSDCTHG